MMNAHQNSETLHAAAVETLAQLEGWMRLLKGACVYGRKPFMRDIKG